MSALGGSFPVDVPEAVPWHVVAQFFKLPALSRSPRRVRTGHSATKKQPCHALTLRQQIWVHAKFVVQLAPSSYQPEAERRDGFHHDGFQLEQASHHWGAIPRG